MLGERLAALRAEQPVVLGLARGGVPVAAEVAQALDAPLDVLLVRKLGLPFQSELGFGALGEDDAGVLDVEMVRRAAITGADIAAVVARERGELVRQVQCYRGDRAPISLGARTVVIVDDGLATGSTARVAINVARARGARPVVVAVPVAAPETAARLAAQADEVVSLITPVEFLAVGEWYDDFDQTTDNEVTSLLQRARARCAGVHAGPGRAKSPG